MRSEVDSKACLAQGLEQFGLTALADPLATYLRLLTKWNTAYNLTAIRDTQAMVNKHVVDSLAIAPYLRGNRIVDVGTGAGLPGIPLALAFPDKEWVLLDSNGKKTRFLQEVKRNLHLPNVEIVKLRVEHYQPAVNFDTVISRAFSSLSQMLSWTKHLVADNGLWLAMKGCYPEAELQQLQQRYQVIPYAVDGVIGERCCVLIENNTKETS